jgi:hypothetical protein
VVIHQRLAATRGIETLYTMDDAAMHEIAKRVIRIFENAMNAEEDA